MSTKIKGDALENIVALLHQMPDVEVEVRAKIPVPGAPRPRDIDVLLKQDVAGYPVRIAIECKNHGEPVGEGLIDAFVGVLKDVGIPSSQGIYVSPTGYTADAKERAARAGIRLLRLEGLNQDRLAAAVNEALLGVFHYVLYVGNISLFPYIPDDSGGFTLRLQPGVRLSDPVVVYEAMWRHWITGKLPWTAGERRAVFRVPPSAAFVEYRVHAYAGTIRGTLSQLSLRNEATAQVEKTRLETEFKAPTTVHLAEMKTEDEIDASIAELAKGDARIVTEKIRVPRIVAGPIFWPPSKEAIARVASLRHAGEPVTFATVEGRDLSRAWEYFESQRAASSG